MIKRAYEAGADTLPSEVFYFPSQAQSNIYNLTYVESKRPLACSPGNLSEVDKCDVIVAYYRPVADPYPNKHSCAIHRFLSNGHSLNAVVKHLDFVYLPGASDIVCTNALFDSSTNEYVIGIGFVKDREKGYLNIYGSTSEEELAECCLSFSELSAMPLHLTHTYYLSPSTGKLQWAFILSCGNPLKEETPPSPGHFDSAFKPPVRVFAQLCDTTTPKEPKNNAVPDSDRLCSTSSSSTEPKTTRRTSSESINTIYGELSVTSAANLFPELAHLPETTILYMDFVIRSTVTPMIRLAAFGAQDGWFAVYETDMNQPAVLRQFMFSHDSAITHVKLFNPDADQCDFNANLTCKREHGSEKSGSQRIDLLVCSAFESAVVYTNILEANTLSLENQIILPQSADFDHVNCASVGDYDFDGQAEIVLGTFGQCLLFYHWETTAKTKVGAEQTHSAGEYRLIAQKRLIAPVHCLLPPLDLAGDGLCSLVVLSSRGLHIYRHSVEFVLDLISDRLSQLLG